MTNLGTHQPIVLLVPDDSNIESAWRFCKEHLQDCVADVRVGLDAEGLGEAIGLAFDVGNVRALRQQNFSFSRNALPAAFPISKAKKLIAAYALLLALDGAPGVHWHHLDITQQKTFEGIAKLMRLRATHAAFDIHSQQQALDLPTEIFGLLRWQDAAQPMPHNKLVCLVNVSAQAQLVSLDWRALLGTRNAIRDLISGVRFNVHGPSLELQPYQVMWATI